jgi:predicted RNA-binding Zn-ribbon protein involved in translation (DUF1610 family)
MTCWRTSEPCPACGSDLTLTDTGHTVTWNCPACGWTDIWEGGDAA